MQASTSSVGTGWHIYPSDLKYGCSNGMEYVWLANFTGCPAITAPVGYVDPVDGEGNVPIGLMGMSERWLSEGLEGGRVKPGKGTDVLALAREIVAESSGAER